jgi:1-deoxy-D-xylulose-5-phosphate synthase
MTAGMPDGTGLEKFAKAHPDKFQDIGIAESCTVDMAGGMARAGLKPVVAIYSTFLQRAFDQVFQEVVLQGLPVLFCLDRAGLIGGDGAVHHGFLDIAYLRGFPNMTVLAPADESELKAALRFALQQNTACAIRYPRDNVPEPLDEATPFVLGKARLLQEGADATIIAYGATVSLAMDAAELLAADDLSVRVYNARFAKPMDHDMVRQALAADHPVITVEDHSVAGGFGSAVLEAASDAGVDTSRVRRLGIPDHFIEHGERGELLADLGLDTAGIVAACRALAQSSHLTSGQPWQPTQEHVR